MFEVIAKTMWISVSLFIPNIDKISINSYESWQLNMDGRYIHSLRINPNRQHRNSIKLHSTILCEF